jgi:hypothetical protein
MLGLQWFGPKKFGGIGIGPRSWQAWIVIAVYLAVVFGLVPLLALPQESKHQIWGIATALLIAIMLATYKGNPPD